jgi:beta-lactamase superfamily II metal-dependent hydrolase
MSLRLVPIAVLLALLGPGCFIEYGEDAEPEPTDSIEQPTTTGRPDKNNFVVHVIDVSTGQAVFVWGHDFTLLYDGGSNDDRRTGADNRLMAYLNAIGFPPGSTIDHLVLSHPHRDHVELLADVVNQYTVSNVWDSGGMNDTKGYHCFIRAVAAKARAGTLTYNTAAERCRLVFENAACDTEAMPDRITIRNGQTFTASPTAPKVVYLGVNARMRILFARSPTSPTTNLNEYSLVTRLDLGGRKVMIMGDAEAGGRTDDLTVAPSATSIEGVLPAAPLQMSADLLITGHHGSNTSTRRDTLNRINPTYAIVSSGPFPYGEGVVLPDANVLTLLRWKVGVNGVYTTQNNDGARCRTSNRKIGTANDDRDGGCDNIHISIENGVMQRPAYWPRPL